VRNANPAVQSASPAVQAGRAPHPRTVVCSPHFDDAVLSCWSLLERDESCTVVNVFTGAPGGGFIPYYDQLSGVSSSAAYMHERALEDRDALSVAGKAPINLGMLEQQYRLRQSPLLHMMFRRIPALPFGMLRLPFLRPVLYSIRAPDAEQLADAITQAAPGASSLWVPAGIGRHRDHLLLRQAGILLASRGMIVRLYADMPYALRYGWPGWIDAPESERTRDRASAFWAQHLETLRLELGDPVKQARVVRLTSEERARKAMAVGRYITQITSLHSGRGRLEDEGTFAHEVYWELKTQTGAPDRRPA
jgi:hypothetical protein